MTLLVRDGRLDLPIVQGDEFVLQLTYQQNTGTEEVPIWTPKTLAGYTAKLQVKEDYDQPAVISVSETIGDDGVILLDKEGVVGEIEVTLKSSATARLQKDTVWDMFLYPAADRPDFFVGGIFKFRKRVTT